MCCEQEILWWGPWLLPSLLPLTSFSFGSLTESSRTVPNVSNEKNHSLLNIYFPSLFWRNVSPEDLYPENKKTVDGKLNELLYDNIRGWELK